jgi:hypothetical protein
MKELIQSGVCAAIVSVATAGIFAQSTSTPETRSARTSQQQATPSPQAPSAPTPPAQTAQASPEGADRRITVTGCLQETLGAAAPAAGATSPDRSSSEPRFLLTNVTKSSAPDGSASTTPSAAKTYRLVASDAAPHTGKKLELTGTVEDRDSSASATRDSSATTNPSNAPKLRVEAGKVLAGTCSDN